MKPLFSPSVIHISAALADFTHTLDTSHPWSCTLFVPSITQRSVLRSPGRLRCHWLISDAKFFCFVFLHGAVQISSISIFKFCNTLYCNIIARKTRYHAKMRGERGCCLRQESGGSYLLRLDEDRFLLLLGVPLFVLHPSIRSLQRS